jgi:hypothetical protein
MFEPQAIRNMTPYGVGVAEFLFVRYRVSVSLVSSATLRNGFRSFPQFLDKTGHEVLTYARPIRHFSTDVRRVRTDMTNPLGCKKVKKYIRTPSAVSHHPSHPLELNAAPPAEGWQVNEVVIVKMRFQPHLAVWYRRSCRHQRIMRDKRATGCNRPRPTGNQADEWLNMKGKGNREVQRL